ncbi:AAA family ATPase [Dokdonella immobilis]|uniref:Homeodomain-like domain-containing protein n=1 Tax=Dokdonella immobilis TaxID=578942 RepID=A0A1I4WPE2_9GAMM|nr:AAA family ATPase [Dokdonella immobilis]SFN14889.1 Homeodomain-like domain-containing protein [Dokdonella immobilis]
MSRLEQRAFEATEQPSKREGRPVVAVGAHDLLAADFPPRDMLLSPWLLSQSLAMIHAWRGIGKTHLAMLIAYALGSGGQCLSWSAPAPVPTLYIDGEMPGAALRDRLARIVEISEEEPPEGFLRFVTPDLQPDGIMPDLSTYEGQNAIERVLGDAKVIVVDNLSCLARTGKENEGDSWQPVAEWALRMRATGRTVIFIHHSGKGGTQRGTSKREDLLDVVMLLKRPADYNPTQGARFEIHFEKARSLYGQEVKPIEATLETLPNGRQTWAMHEVSDVADAAMIELAELGLPHAEIARELGCHRSTVLRALRKAEQEGRFSPKKKPKRKERDRYGDD